MAGNQTPISATQPDPISLDGGAIANCAFVFPSAELDRTVNLTFYDDGNDNDSGTVALALK